MKNLSELDYTIFNKSEIDSYMGIYNFEGAGHEMKALIELERDNHNRAAMFNQCANMLEIMIKMAKIDWRKKYARFDFSATIELKDYDENDMLVTLVATIETETTQLTRVFYIVNTF